MSSTPEQAMSDSRELRNPMGQPSGSASPSHMKLVRLSRQDAANWLRHTNECLTEYENQHELESLRNALEDACWLARWKREQVILELPLTVLPAMLETLVRIHADEPSAEAAASLERILQTLSVS